MNPTLWSLFHSYSYSYSIFILCPHIWSLASVPLFSSISPCSSCLNKTRWQPFLFRKGHHWSWRWTYLPSQEFSAWSFLLLSFPLSHKSVQVWSMGCISHAVPGWVWLVRGQSQDRLQSLWEGCCDGLVASFMGLAARNRPFGLCVHCSKVSLKYLENKNLSLMILYPLHAWCGCDLLARAQTIFVDWCPKICH